MARVAILLALLLLPACGNDGAKSVRVTFVKHQDDVRQLCGPSFLEPYGCAKVHGNSCEIVAIKPYGFDDQMALKTLGHELLHCLWGPKHV